MDMIKICQVFIQFYKTKDVKELLALYRRQS